jgi:hypothetical protein
MESTADLTLWVALWLVTALFLVHRHWRRGRGVGLMLAYVVSFGAIHWLATAMYLLPWYQHVDPTLVAEGMRQSGIAIFALAVGSEVTSWILDRRAVLLGETEQDPAPADPFAVSLYLAIGLLLQVVLFPLAKGIPSVTALVVAGSALTVVGISLKCWNAWRVHDRRTLAFWLIASAGLPFFTVATQGFLGYGMAAMMTILAFIAAFHGRSWIGLVAGLLVAYLGLSVYVTYMRDRAQIRSVVWSGSSLNDRLDSVLETVGNPELFDPRDLRQLERIDERLNQNFLVGAAVRYLQDGHVDYARGSTVTEAALSIVPRALWPDKPIGAGSGDLVSIYTGLEFSRDTSVGIGQVMEWYVNFGSLGVIFGFLLLGFLITLVDRRALYWAEQGDVQRFAIWYLPGLTLLQVGGAFVEMTSTAAAALAVTGILHFVTRRSGTAAEAAPEFDPTHDAP